MKPNSIYANITAVGKYLPESIITNQHFETELDTSDDWIVSRTGIKQRHKVSDGQASVYMAVKAVEDLFRNSNVSAGDIDSIIVCTITPDMFFPSCACLVQKEIGANKAWGFDLSAACSGFVFGLETASNMIQSGNYKKIIVIGVDTMSSILDYTDRNTCILFGDGAGAVLLESNSTHGIMDSILKVDGNGGDYLYMPGGGSLNPSTEETIANKLHYVKQDGANVFKRAVKGMTNVTLDLMNRNQLNSNEIDLFIPHQANKRIIESVANKLNLNDEQVLINIDKYANTTAATIPIGIHDAINRKKLKHNDNLILSTFGAGFTWGSMYIKWNSDD